MSELTHGFYLARVTGPMDVSLEDGVHSDPESVAKAAKLHDRIFGDTGPWAMVEVTELPDLDPPINEQAADGCARLVAWGKGEISDPSPPSPEEEAER